MSLASDDKEENDQLKKHLDRMEEIIGRKTLSLEALTGSIDTKLNEKINPKTKKPSKRRKEA